MSASSDKLDVPDSGFSLGILGNVFYLKGSLSGRRSSAVVVDERRVRSYQLNMRIKVCFLIFGVLNRSSRDAEEESPSSQVRA